MLYISLASRCNSISYEESDSLYMDYDQSKVPFAFYMPDKILELHRDLEEISGLSWFDNMLWAVEDENGYLYGIDPATGSITQKVKFAKDGDYEGVELSDEKAFAIQSDGDLFRFSLMQQDEVPSVEIETDFSSRNNVEGLAIWNDKLLIACKGKGEIDDDDVKGKAVYLYDISKDKVELLFHFDEDDLEREVDDRKYFNKIHSFDPSGIAIDPITQDIYWLSADKVMVVLSSDFKIREVVPLSRKTYRQPEGICFDSQGTLYIASEGDGGEAKIFRLSRLQ